MDPEDGLSSSSSEEVQSRREVRREFAAFVQRGHESSKRNDDGGKRSSGPRSRPSHAEPCRHSDVDARGSSEGAPRLSDSEQSPRAGRCSDDSLFGWDSLRYSSSCGCRPSGPASSRPVLEEKEVQVQSAELLQCNKEVATETDLVWKDGFYCKHCVRPPLPPKVLDEDQVVQAMKSLHRSTSKTRNGAVLEGTWTLLAAHRHVTPRALCRLLIRGNSCLDLLGNKYKMEREGGKVSLLGGRLIQEGENLLHRYSEQGVHTLYTRGSAGVDWEAGEFPRAPRSRSWSPRRASSASRASS